MAIAMFVVSAAIVGAFVIVSINETEEEVKEFAGPIVNQVSGLDSVTRLDQFIGNKHGSTIRMTIFNSSGEAIGDTHDINQLKETTLSFDPQVAAILTDTSENPVIAKYATIYKSSYTMYTYYVKVGVSNKVDPNGFLVVRLAKASLVGSTPFLIFIIALVVFWIVVVVAIAVIFNLNIKASMEPLTTVQAIMENIKQGKYKRTVVNKLLVASEADKMVEEIDKMGAVINDTMHNLNVLLESITQGIIAFDKNGDVIFSNSKAIQMFGMDPKEGLSKKFLTEYAKEYAKFKESLKTHVETSFDNIVNGEYLHIQTIFPPQEEDLDMYMLLVITDMTEQQKTAKAKQEFFANASHELKTPLTAISGYSEILSMTKPTEKQIEKCSKEIQANTLRMKTLIDEMLQLSKMDAQSNALDTEEFSLATLCSETIDELRVVAKKHDIDIKISGDATLVGNYKEIMMLVKNLVSNAIKYNKDGGYVNIDIKSTSKAVILSIKDNGIGIAKENQDKVFERFYRVDESRGTNHDESSTGLGLSIVKEVVEDHDGEIELKSDLGKGTEFIVTFPKR